MLTEGINGASRPDPIAQLIARLNIDPRRRLVKILAPAVFAIGLTSLALSPTHADVLYVYSGNPLLVENRYDVEPGDVAGLFVDVDLNCAGTCGAGTYTYTSGILGFTIGEQGLPSFLDLTPAEAAANGGSSSATITLDASGNVVAWDIAAYGGVEGSGYRFSTLGGGHYVGDYFNRNDNGPGGTAANVNDPGTWSDPPTPTPTPLPATLPLLAGGLGAMGLLGRRRKRKNHGDRSLI
jgi:hypothetical protein